MLPETTREIEVGGRKLVFKQLTVRQIADAAKAARKARKESALESLRMAGAETADIAASLSEIDGKPVGYDDLLPWINSLDGRYDLARRALGAESADLDTLDAGQLLEIAAWACGLEVSKVQPPAEGADTYGEPPANPTKPATAPATYDATGSATPA